VLPLFSFLALVGAVPGRQVTAGRVVSRCQQVVNASAQGQVVQIVEEFVGPEVRIAAAWVGEAGQRGSCGGPGGEELGEGRASSNPM